MSIVDYSNTVIYSSARNAYIVPRMKRMMNRTVWAMTKRLRKGSFKPEGYEVSFGSGKIDRIDTCETEDQVYVKILDYKTGAKSFDMALLSWSADATGGVYGRSSPAGGKKTSG